MRKPYCCESSRRMFDQYYFHLQKGGGDFPVYVGRYRQSGHGLGNILGSLFRKILSVFEIVCSDCIEDWRQYSRRRLERQILEGFGN